MATPSLSSSPRPLTTRYDPTAGGAAEGRSPYEEIKPSERAKGQLLTLFHRHPGRMQAVWDKSVQVLRSYDGQWEYLHAQLKVAKSSVEDIGQAKRTFEISTEEPAAIEELYRRLVCDKSVPKAVIFCDFCVDEAKSHLQAYQESVVSLERGKNFQGALSAAEGCLEQVQECQGFYEKFLEEAKLSYPETKSRRWERDYIGPEKFSEITSELREAIAIHRAQVERQEAVRLAVMGLEESRSQLASCVDSFLDKLQTSMDTKLSYEEVYATCKEELESMVSALHSLNAKLESKVMGRALRGTPEGRGILAETVKNRKYAEFFEKELCDPTTRRAGVSYKSQQIIDSGVLYREEGAGVDPSVSTFIALVEASFPVEDLATGMAALSLSD